MNQMIISDKNQVETEVNFDEEDLMVSIFLGMQLLMQRDRVIMHEALLEIFGESEFLFWVL